VRRCSCARARITAQQVEDACGRKLLSKEELLAQGQQAPRASGTLESHYAPSATVRLMDAKALQPALDLLSGTDSAGQAAHPLRVYHRSPLHVAIAPGGCPPHAVCMPSRSGP